MKCLNCEEEVIYREGRWVDDSVDEEGISYASLCWLWVKKGIADEDDDDFFYNRPDTGFDHIPSDSLVRMIQEVEQDVQVQ